MGSDGEYSIELWFLRIREKGDHKRGEKGEVIRTYKRVGKPPVWSRLSDFAGSPRRLMRWENLEASTLTAPTYPLFCCGCLKILLRQTVA
jgi:hypothetical protein